MIKGLIKRPGELWKRYNQESEKYEERFAEFQERWSGIEKKIQNGNIIFVTNIL